MILRTECKECGLNKLSHIYKDNKVISIRCRGCGWIKEFSKPKATRYLRDKDYND